MTHVQCPTCLQRVPMMDEETESTRETLGELKYTLYLRHKRHQLRNIEKYAKEAREKIRHDNNCYVSGLFELLIVVEQLMNLSIAETDKKLLLNGDTKV